MPTNDIIKLKLLHNINKQYNLIKIVALKLKPKLQINNNEKTKNIIQLKIQICNAIITKII